MFVTRTYMCKFAVVWSLETLCHPTQLKLILSCRIESCRSAECVTFGLFVHQRVVLTIAPNRRGQGSGTVFTWSLHDLSMMVHVVCVIVICSLLSHQHARSLP